MSKRSSRGATRRVDAARIQRAFAPLMNVATAALLLRVFLGGTMLYAGVDKAILDPRFLQPDGVGSIGETLRLFVTAGGPLAPLVSAVAVGQPVLIGAVMAGAQVLVGALLLSGSWVRLGALLGAAISLSLALTASWGVSPYYYGNDLPYLVAFLVLASIGDGGILRAGAPVTRGHDPQRRAALFTGGGAILALLVLVALDRSRLAGLLAPNSGTNATPTPRATATPSGAASGSPEPTPSPTASETPAGSASPSGAASGSPEPTPSPTASETPAGSASPSPSATGGKTPQPSPSATAGGGSVGTVIAGGSSLSSGQALNFSAGSTAAVLLKDGSTYRAFERACTHQGTNVDWEPANGSFYCSNHGARFSSTGDAIVGPARTPLRPIAVSVAADGTVSYTR